MNTAGQENKIGLLGGTFDPVHSGHLQIATWALNHLSLQRFLFIPNNVHPFFKRSDITTVEQRVTMLQLAITGQPAFAIEPFEVQRDKISYTVDTLRYLRQKYPKSELLLFMGSDNVPDFDRWKEAEMILNLVRVCVYPRTLKGRKVDESDTRFTFLNSPEIKISSTEIRKRIAAGKSCTSLLPPVVESYIRENNLYSRL